ncbi:CoA pyrophosphatase [Sphingomonas sp. BIUV-7]|uniref:CoA pyrophosphatase n=1 Tax=Sphingomonas natans TaxID=3063330 RepID=A0ABT8Y906_9SPHN|nr:CoA pyrophosphatase [Sphingomonas sp. BIUV-7]MDO6414813.1 CoA pyrophosphatase [Sphingomonas sp. BIUV-7]
MRLADRLRAALDPASDAIGGDAFLSAGLSFTDAAVLVPITDRPEPGVLLTLRRADMRHHAGQVAFPGGRVDPDDADAIAAALREADEEIGLDPALVQVIGTSDRYRTFTGYEIVPVVGIVPPDLALTPHEAEVAAVFEVPLAFLLESANHVRLVHEDDGRSGEYYEIMWGEWRIWGATAAMIVTLSEKLRAFA